MGKVTRKRHTAEFKARVALEAIKGEQTLAEIGAKHGVHLTLVAAWKRAAIEGMTGTFASKAATPVAGAGPAEVSKLHAKIGELIMERDFFGESLRPMSVARRRELVAPDHEHLSIARQCELLSISRSGFYYAPCGASEFTLRLMRLIDEQFLETPFYGARQMMRHLRRSGHRVGRHRVRRLMRLMGLAAVYQKPRTSVPHPEHVVYPYLLRDLTIDRPNQVWCADITYIPMRRGFLYLVAVMDWATRKVLSWRVSNTMEADFCIVALEEAIGHFGVPEMFNTDQGSQFTSPRFTGVLAEAGIRISMDGRGRWMDNVFIERLWRSLKYECVYLHAYETGSELRAGLSAWVGLYNARRPHTALAGRTPDEVYGLARPLPAAGHARQQATVRLAA